MQILAYIRGGFSAFADWLYSLPYAKGAYVAIIAFVIVVLAREIYIVLFDRTVYVGNFEYFSSGKSSQEDAKSFPSYVLGQYRLLRAALIEENRQRQELRKAAASGNDVYRALPSTLPELSTWAPLLADAEIKIQGFDIGKTLTLLRTWVAPPREITGFVDKSAGGSRAIITWPQSGNDPDLRTPFETGILTNDSSAAFALAASIVWSNTAASNKEFRNIPRDVFVFWALAWWDYRILRSRVALGQNFDEEDKKRWKQARALSEKLIPNAQRFAEIWRLRADIIEIAPRNLGATGVYPDQAALDADLNLAGEDRKKYATNLTLPNFVTALLKTNPAFAQLFAAVSKATIDKSAIGPESVSAGRPVWVRRASTATKQPQASQAADISLTVTAIVTDNEVKKLLLPDYAIIDATDDDEFEFRLSPTGPVIARAKKTDMVTPAGPDVPIGRGVVLAKLVADTGTNIIPTPAGPVTLMIVADLPSIGSELTMITIGSRTTTKFSARTGGLAVVTPRITSPGLGGAPILDMQGRLVAMAYSGAERETHLLPLKWLFDQKQLKLK